MTTKKKAFTDKIIRTTLRLPQSLWTETRIAALQEHMSAADLVIKALETYLKKEGR